MDFAPYQSSPPEQSRLASPTTSPRASADIRRPSPFAPAATTSPPPLQHPQPQRGTGWDDFQNRNNGWNNSPAQGFGGQQGFGNTTTVAGGSGIHGPGGYAAEVSQFDTSLGFRLDYEACAAYLLCPPLGAIALLILERNSDYVRFHAWQSALVFTALLVLHLLFAWSSFLSWVLFLGDIALIALMVMRAYQDAEVLDRYELPFFGRLASNFVDDE